jgi:O-antigen ligase
MDDVLRTPAGPWAAAPMRAVGSRAAGWDLLLVTVTVYVATAVGRIHQLFTTLLPMKPALVSALLALALLLLQQSGQRRVGLLRSATTSCLLGLLVWGALSVPGALNQGLAFQTWTDLVRSVLMGLVIAASIRDVHDIERLILVYFGVTVVYTAVVLSRFQLGADSWRLAGLYYYDANDFATLIATAMPLGLYYILARHRPLLRALAAAGLAVLAVGLIKSGSRGGFLALLAVTAFVLLRFTTVPARTRAVALVIILLVAGTSASDKYWAQMQTIIHPDQDYNSTSDAGRLKIWTRGLGYMADYPVLGVGIGNFPTAEGTISPLAKRQERGVGVRWGAAHNSFVQVGAELGIPGLLLFVAMIATAFRSLRHVAAQHSRASRVPDDVARLAQSLMAALVGFSVGAFFLSLGYADMLCALVAFAIALAKTARGDAARSQPRPRNVPI